MKGMKKWGSAHCSIWKSNLNIENNTKDTYRTKTEASRLNSAEIEIKAKDEKWIVREWRAKKKYRKETRPKERRRIKKYWKRKDRKKNSGSECVLVVQFSFSPSSYFLFQLCCCCCFIQIFFFVVIRSFFLNGMNFTSFANDTNTNDSKPPSNSNECTTVSEEERREVKKMKMY